jgi:hypothetical protein
MTNDLGSFAPSFHKDSMVLPSFLQDENEAGLLSYDLFATARRCNMAESKLTTPGFPRCCAAQKFFPPRTILPQFRFAGACYCSRHHITKTHLNL